MLARLPWVVHDFLCPARRLRPLSGFALTAGEAFFAFYWGLAFAYDLGRWGFKLGWY